MRKVGWLSRIVIVFLSVFLLEGPRLRRRVSSRTHFSLFEILAHTRLALRHFGGKGGHTQR